MTSLSDLARRAGFDVVTGLSNARLAIDADGVDVADLLIEFAALHRASIIAELCADAEPVYQVCDERGWHDSSYENYYSRTNDRHYETRILYPASTVAALKARVAELEKDAERLDWLNENFYNREKNDWDATVYKDSTQWVFFAPEGVQGDIRVVLDEALRSKK